MRVLVFGTFDHLHPGHHYMLQHAQERGELFVVVAQDHNVDAIKGRQPMQTQAQRMDAIKKEYPDATVLPGDPVDYAKPLEDIDPDLVILGYDQQLPPGVTSDDFKCPVERMTAYKPEKYKSSLRTNN